MVNAINDLINLFSEWAESPGFAQGAAFVIVMLFLGSLMDVPIMIHNIIWSVKSSRNCELRYDGLLVDPCHCKDCPAHNVCAYYQPRERWSFFKSLFQRKKDGVT